MNKICLLLLIFACFLPLLSLAKRFLRGIAWLCKPFLPDSINLFFKFWLGNCPFDTELSALEFGLIHLSDGLKHLGLFCKPDVPYSYSLHSLFVLDDPNIDDLPH